MTCKQLGGACDLKFHGTTFEEITEQSKKHGIEMYQKQDQAHLKAMNGMQVLMQKPDEMKAWYDGKKKQFDSLPENL